MLKPILPACMWWFTT